MLQKLIDYLIAQPTSPLYELVNSTAMRTVLSNNATPVSEVKCWNSHASDLTPPFVLLQMQQDTLSVTPFLGGGNITDYYLRIQCTARGKDASDAKNKSWTLAYYVWQVLNKAASDNWGNISESLKQYDIFDNAKEIASIQNIYVLPLGSPPPDGGLDDGVGSGQKGKMFTGTEYVRAIVKVRFNP